MNTAKELASPLVPMLVLGHRGATCDQVPFYQNSLKAFERAVATADGFETDACVDKDGEVFLIHESKDIGYGPAFEGVAYNAAEHLDAASAELMGYRRIDQMTTSEMLALRLKDGSPIPTLKETIELVGAHPGKLLNIELKAHDVAPHVLRLVKQSVNDGVIAPENLLVSSFNYPALALVRKEMPELQIGAIFNYPDAPAKPMFPWYPGSSGAYMPLVAASLEQDVLKRVQPDVFIMPEEILTKDNVAMIASRYPDAKCAAWVFTEKGGFNLPGMLERLRDLQPTRKVGAMIVDNPGEFIRTLRAG